MKIINPNYNLLVITGVFVFTCSFFLVEQTFDLRIFDTFYVIHLKNLYWCLAGLLFLFYLFYRFLLVPHFSKWLTIAHIILTVLSSLMIVIYHLWSGQLYLLNKSLNLYDVPQFYKNNFALTILLFLLGSVQVTLFINLIRGLAGRWKK